MATRDHKTKMLVSDSFLNRVVHIKVPVLDQKWSPESTEREVALLMRTLPSIYCPLILTNLQKPQVNQCIPVPGAVYFV